MIQEYYASDGKESKVDPLGNSGTLESDIEKQGSDE
jgi:hypothetical protein